MTGTLRDRLAAVLGPGNDDTTAYAQADAVLELLADQPQYVCVNNGLIYGPFANPEAAARYGYERGFSAAYSGISTIRRPEGTVQ